ncbi:Flavodoxin [Sporomusa ovata DSM 2662]|uniref:Flavodoxin n=1 Tax=Sporomusa ovata TaxID=2378 RepID=A0A0U1KZI1_9FIRM|nr:flavodoxin [Sporomusa ovata]EQB28925.1 flavodoxin [Sporomusa ovata DSM 2662]CQR72353.1 Flavodoxin [Sporomusa ovata]
MKKIVVIYWSGTGNTEAMAKAVAEGAQNENTEVSLLSVSESSIEDVINADAVALGCPSMGAEVLEELEMEPFVLSIEGVISGKPLALFGSYGWGNGEWMQDWVQRMQGSGAKVLGEGLIIMETPDHQGLDKCKVLGSNLSKE